MNLSKIYNVRTNSSVLSIFINDKATEIPKDKRQEYNVKLKEDYRYVQGKLIPYAFCDFEGKKVYIAHVKEEKSEVYLFDIILEREDLMYGIGAELSDPICTELLFN